MRASFYNLLFCLCSSVPVWAELRINEIYYNAPGSDDGQEYIELKGTPNLEITNDTYLVFIEGDASGEPGTVQNIFELTGFRIGGNGFLVLLQKDHPYTVNSNATVIVNTGELENWGDGSGTPLEHEGEGGRTDIENGSFSCLLIEANEKPDVETTIDADTNGIPDGVYSDWTVLDSIGALDDSGVGDFSYASTTFIENTGIGATGVVHVIGFRPSYLGRADTPTGWAVGNELGGVSPDWTLGLAANTDPPILASEPLAHIGSPNFGLPEVPGVLVHRIDSNLVLDEYGMVITAYTIQLNVAPTGDVMIAVDVVSDLEFSFDMSTWLTSGDVVLSNNLARTVHVRGVADDILEPRPHEARIMHGVVSTGDPDSYPSGTIVPEVCFGVNDDEVLSLNELLVNPPGEDASLEFVELAGRPDLQLENVYLLFIDGDDGDDPGTLDFLLPLGGASMGSNGFLFVGAANHPYALETNTTTWFHQNFEDPGGILENGSLTVLLVATENPPDEGDDLDAGDNGILEGLDNDTFVLDSVGYTDGNTDDIVFTTNDITQVSGTPDALTWTVDGGWFRGNLNPQEFLRYKDFNNGKYVLPTFLSPGTTNSIGASFDSISPISGVVGDATNPLQTFANPNGFGLLAFSSNPSVVPNANLMITGCCHLAIEPVGVGYATITVRVSQAGAFVDVPFEYAASAPGGSNTTWLTTVSDASAALPVSGDFMLIADDENQVLRLYPRYVSGPPLVEYDIEPFLGLTDFEDGFPREVDIEAVTRTGDLAYWMGSHSHAEIGELRVNRWNFIATDLVEDGTNTQVLYRGHYTELRDDLIAWDQSDGHGLGANFLGLFDSAAEGVLPKSIDGSGFNIEGLCMAPGETNVAYVCFRAPLVPATNRAFALVVPVTNIYELVTGSGPALFDEPILLNLGCRGVRSIEGDTNGYLIVAGNVDNTAGPNAFRYFTWTGHPMNDPQLRGGDFFGLNPEAIVSLPPQPWNENTMIQVVSDNGRAVYYNDSIVAKRLPIPAFKKFRADWVALGPPSIGVPILRNLNIVGNDLTFTWCAPIGSSVRLEYASAVDASIWTPLSTNTVTVPLNQSTFSTVGGGLRLFRIVEE